LAASNDQSGFAVGRKTAVILKDDRGYQDLSPPEPKPDRLELFRREKLAKAKVKAVHTEKLRVKFTVPLEEAGKNGIRDKKQFNKVIQVLRDLEKMRVADPSDHSQVYDRFIVEDALKELGRFIVQSSKP